MKKERIPTKKEKDATTYFVKRLLESEEETIRIKEANIIQDRINVIVKDRIEKLERKIERLNRRAGI